MEGKRYHRVWCDGCFDVAHFGHYNFMRQCAGLADELYVGVHNDEEITKNKAKPVFTFKERLELVNACRWPTKVIPNAPFSAEVDWLKRFGCEACIHGDDLVLNADGVDCYQAMKDANMFATVPRTKAISTTNLIGRMLRLSKDQLPEGFDTSLLQNLSGDVSKLYSYLPTTHRISQFAPSREPTKDDKIVYVDGTFDLMHPGHVTFLRKAKELGTYLVVGIHADPLPGEDRPKPIMTLQERVLNVLSVKYVDDVIIGAPYIITKALMDQVEPSVVAEGSSATRPKSVDAFKIPKEMGIFKQIESDYPEFTAKLVIKRILDDYQTYAKRNATKEKSPFEINGQQQ